MPPDQVGAGPCPQASAINGGRVGVYTVLELRTVDACIEVLASGVLLFQCGQTGLGLGHPDTVGVGPDETGIVRHPIDLLHDGPLQCFEAGPSMTRKGTSRVLGQEALLHLAGWTRTPGWHSA